MKKIAIVGSGLAAISAAKVLVSRGYKPVILDSGELIHRDRSNIVSKLSMVSPSQWNDADKNFITSNPSVHNKKSLPRKLAFGSDYFYGKSTEILPVETDGKIPPFSYAKGGLSVGWGAAVLPPDNDDLESWPIKREQLDLYFRKVLDGLPFSAIKDDLSNVFPLYSEKLNPLNLTQGNNSLLKSLNNSRSLKGDKTIVFGQSRLLVQASDDDNGVGCKSCGHCMSGCVYDCIYKSSQDLERLIKADVIEYIPNIYVQSVREKNSQVEVSFISKDGQQDCLVFDRIFLAAGAIGSARIVMKSKGIYNKPVKLLSTVGFVVPMFRFMKADTDWPNVNTQPGIFLEFKSDDPSGHWVHTQLSTPNEMVFEKLGIMTDGKGLMHWLKKKLVSHLVIAHCNLHSDHAYEYSLTLKKDSENNHDVLFISHQYLNDTQDTINKAAAKLFSIGRRIGCFSMSYLIQSGINSVSGHVGGSLPMKSLPINETDTDLQGCPKGWTRIHVVDSSTFPSLPGTTVGLLAMANATRIISELDLDV